MCGGLASLRRGRASSDRLFIHGERAADHVVDRERRLHAFTPGRAQRPAQIDILAAGKKYGKRIGMRSMMDKKRLSRLRLGRSLGMANQGE